MISTIAPQAGNPHLAALEAAFAQATRPVNWLVIAHNDLHMLTALWTALADQSAVVLELAQETWDFDSRQLPEAIDWALEHSPITSIVLVGHSQAGEPLIRAALAPVEAPRGGSDNYARLVAGARRNSARTDEARERFAAQVQQMSQLPSIRSRSAGGELAVYTLFYQAHSGLFFAYHAGEKAFYPLVP